MAVVLTGIAGSNGRGDPVSAGFANPADMYPGPGTVAGRTLVLFCVAAGDQVFAAPSGWTAAPEFDLGVVCVYYKTADGTELNTNLRPGVSGSTGQYAIWLFELTGLATGTSPSPYQWSPSTGSGQAQGTAFAQVDSLVVWFWLDSGNFGAGPTSTLTNITGDNGTVLTSPSPFSFPLWWGGSSGGGLFNWAGVVPATYSVSDTKVGPTITAPAALSAGNDASGFIEFLLPAAAPAPEREYAPKSSDLVAFNRRVEITELPYQISTTMIKRPE